MLTEKELWTELMEGMEEVTELTIQKLRELSEENKALKAKLAQIADHLSEPVLQEAVLLSDEEIKDVFPRDPLATTIEIAQVIEAAVLRKNGLTTGE